MVRFRDTSTGKIRTVYKLYKKADNNRSLWGQFTESGKLYTFYAPHIELIEGEIEYFVSEESKVKEKEEQELKKIRKKLNTTKTKQELHIYEMSRQCPNSKCKKITNILTYLLYDDETNQSLVYPWDLKRLNEGKKVYQELEHMIDGFMEYYPIKTIGSNAALDRLMMEQFPDRIRNLFSQTQKRKYPMNICEHCEAKQGEVPVRMEIWEELKKMKPLKLVKIIER